jgi:hypothetical protein
MTMPKQKKKMLTKEKRGAAAVATTTAPTAVSRGVTAASLLGVSRVV